MKRFPERFPRRVDLDGCLVAAAHVGPGVPWKHTVDWKPPPTPEPAQPGLRVGQVWRTRDGKEVTITVEDNGALYPFKGSNDEWYVPDGRWLADGDEHYGDLIELITDAPETTPTPTPTPEPATPEPWPLPRVFAAPIRRTFLPSGGQVLDAIADDGTCWQMFPSDTGWQQVQPLPPATEEQG